MADQSAVPPSARELPTAPGHWLLGHAREMAASPHLLVARLAAAHDGAARFRLLHRRFVAVADPSLARQLLINHPELFPRSFHYGNTALVTGPGMLATDGPLWQERRRMAQPAFKSPMLATAVAATATAVAARLPGWSAAARSGTPHPLHDDCQHLALSVIGHALLSEEVAAADAGRFVAALRAALWHIRRRNTSVFPLPTWLPTPAHRALHATRADLDAFVAPRIAARLAGERRSDILQTLVDARIGEATGPAPESTLRDETKTLFAAGFETTAAALTWALYRLADDQAAQQRVADEVATVLGDRQPTAADLDRLTWTEAVVDEVLRLHPPVYNMARAAQADAVVDGRQFRRGDIVMISVYGLHRHPIWGADAERFNPERFLTGGAPRQAYLPFGLGRHTCIGNTFALAELTIAVALICRSFCLSPVVGQGIPAARAQITLAPASDVPLIFTPR